MSPQPAGSHSLPRRRVLPQQGSAGGRRDRPGRSGGRREGLGQAGERRAGPGQAGTLLPVRGRCSAESEALVWILNSMSADPVSSHSGTHCTVCPGITDKKPDFCRNKLKSVDME